MKCLSTWELRVTRIRVRCAAEPAAMTPTCTGTRRPGAEPGCCARGRRSTLNLCFAQRGDRLHNVEVATRTVRCPPTSGVAATHLNHGASSTQSDITRTWLTEQSGTPIGSRGMHQTS